MNFKFASLVALVLVLTACGDMNSCCDNSEMAQVEQDAIPGEFRKKPRRVGPPPTPTRVGRVPRPVSPTVRCWFSRLEIPGTLIIESVFGKAERSLGEITCASYGAEFLLQRMCITAHATQIVNGQSSDVPPLSAEVQQSWWWTTNRYWGTIGASTGVSQNNCLEVGWNGGYPFFGPGSTRVGSFTIEFGIPTRGEVSYEFEIQPASIQVHSLNGAPITVETDSVRTNPVRIVAR